MRCSPSHVQASRTLGNQWEKRKSLAGTSGWNTRVCCLKRKAHAWSTALTERTHTQNEPRASLDSSAPGPDLIHVVTTPSHRNSMCASNAVRFGLPVDVDRTQGLHERAPTELAETRGTRKRSRRVQHSTQRWETLTDMGPRSSMRHPKPRTACCASFCRVPPSLRVGLVAVVLPCWRLPVFGSAVTGFVCRRQACQIAPQACRGGRPLWGRLALRVTPWFALLRFCSVRRHLSLRMERR